MENRFFCTALLVLTSFLFGNSLCAQLTFQFNYSGPDTLFVGNNCEAPLEWGHPATVTAECTLAGGGDCMVDTLEISEISDGYLIGDPIAANETVTITYRAVSDTMQQEAFFSFAIFFADTIPPSFNIPPDVTINCDQSTEPSLTGSVTAVVDNCSDIADTSFTDLVLAGSCIQNYTILRRWQLTDQNGNQSQIREQRISLQDINKPSFTTLPEDQTVSCGTTSNIEAAFQAWVANRGSASATDNCTPAVNLRWFAAVPASFDLTDPLTFPGESVGLLDTAKCGTAVPGIYRTETVSFVVIDECGNASSADATFTVVDQQAPAFEFCPSDMVLRSEPGTCEAAFELPVPVITDDCADNIENINRSQTKAIRSANPGDDQTIVDTIDYAINIPSVPAFVTSAASLDILLDNVDAEAATEFFYILGEDQSVLGQTNQTNTQCGSSLTSVQIAAAQFNRWAADGRLSIRLAPNVPFGQSPSFGINDICPASGSGGIASIRLAYQVQRPKQLMFSYQIDGGPEVSIDPAAGQVLRLDQGSYNIRYRAMDCAGNESNCLFSVTVEDQEPPSLLCPDDINLALDTAANCIDGVPFTLSLPTAISDNCEPDRYEQVQPASSTEALMTFSYDPNYLDYIADDKSVAFVGTASNAIGAEVRLEVRLTGEVDQPEAYYSVYGEDGSLIGTTEVGQSHVTVSAGDCMLDPAIPAQNISQFTIPVVTFNSWASDGIVDLDLRSNRTFAGSPPGNEGDGINPLCGNFPLGTPDGSIDSVSTITALLSYDRLTPSYSISGATDVSLSPMLPPSILPTPEFQAGSSIVTYIISDLSGNTASCSYEVTVIDTIKPTPVCQPATIFVNPSGSIAYELDPQLLDAGSFDNCELSGRSVSPNIFNCDQIGTTQVVTFTVVDEFGNQGSCETLVQIEAEAPQPDYSIGLCGNDTLYLLANPPAILNGLNYTYSWSGPKGFVSNLENPIIPNADDTNSGTYKLIIRGPSACEVSTSFEVFINSSPNTPVIRTSSDQLCENDTLLLSTQSYSGNNIAYNWYAGSFPNGTLLASTTIPLYKKPPPLSDDTYYVIVEIDGCFSDASALAVTTVSDVPLSAVQDAVIEICEGGAFSLGTTISQIGYTYQWDGPNGFQSQSQYPSLVTDVVLADSGVYTLVISNNGCTSDPASTVVRVRPRPDQPVLFSDGVVCNGDSLRFSSNIMGGDLYTWTAPNGTNLSTTDPSLLILNANASHSGNWVVTVLGEGCSSTASDSVNVFVEQPP
ncbi:MAG: HYR domain-containing protein, partial [Bacteroidota bacterium]